MGALLKHLDARQVQGRKQACVGWPALAHPLGTSLICNNESIIKKKSECMVQVHGTILYLPSAQSIRARAIRTLGADEVPRDSKGVRKEWPKGPPTCPR